VSLIDSLRGKPGNSLLAEEERIINIPRDFGEILVAETSSYSTTLSITIC